MVWLDSIAGNFKVAQGIGGKADGVVMVVLVFADAEGAAAHVTDCRHALWECDIVEIVANEQDNPPNGPTEKALNGRLIVIKANNARNARRWVGLSPSCG